MLNSIQSFFQKHILTVHDDDTAEGNEKSLHLATATLLFEMATMDDVIETREREAIQQLLADKFSLDTDMAEELLGLAADTARRATSLQEFTRLLNENFSQKEKQQMIKMLWEVALTDGIIDKYEDLFVRQMADLLYVSHSHLVRAKHQAMDLP